MQLEDFILANSGRDLKTTLQLIEQSAHNVITPFKEHLNAFSNFIEKISKIIVVVK